MPKERPRSITADMRGDFGAKAIQVWWFSSLQVKMEMRNPQMKINTTKSGVALAIIVIAGAVVANSGGQAIVVAKTDLKWKELGIPGVAAAQVSGDMSKGPSRFFLKYPVGLSTPMHSHTADHYATVVSGNVTLIADGKTHKLGPGSYFSLTGKMAHSAKVEGKEPVVFFIQADGPWDVVLD